MIHAFAGCELDEELFQLRRRGRPVKLEPKAFDLLLHLLRNRDRVVSKGELLQAVWPQAAVSESVLPSCVGAVRRAVGDDRARGRVIQTVHGRGYRFVAEVEERPVGASPFVGREDAMRRLGEGLEAALAGRGRLLLLVGEPGIGKTRTADEFAAEARRRGARVLAGRGHEGEGAPAFWPWVRVLRDCLRDADPTELAADMGPGAAEIAELVPELRDRIEELPPSQAGDDEQARFRLFDSLTAFFRRASARVPLLLVLDDLHWADETSLRLLQFLAGELDGARLLVVGTYRDVEVRRGHPLAAVLGALAREATCKRIALRGLDANEAARLVEDLLGKPAPEPLAAAVYEMTEGNPFFIQEMVRLLASDGDLDLERDARARPLALPQSVRDAIGRRLDALPDTCDRLLRTASVLGREFGGPLLARVAELPDDQLLEGIGEALAARVLVESEEDVGRYAFGHALIRQTLYDELDTPERVGLHRRAGEALEQTCGAHPDPHLAELAHHFFQAAPGGDPEKAVDYCTRAAQRAQRLLAYEEAAWQYQRALRALELCVPRDEARRCELQLALGGSHATSGRRDLAMAASQAAAEIARHLGRPDLLARAALGHRSLVEMGAPGDDAAPSLMEEALEALGDTHPSLRARLLSRLVGTPPYADSMQRRDELSREALALALRETDPEALRDALIARRWACLGPDRIDERHALARDMLELAERLGDRSLAAFGHGVLLGAHLLRGETENADRALAAFTRVAEELRQPVFLSLARVWQGSRALDRGEFAAAERLFREALERGHGTVPYAHFIFEGQMHILREARGDPNSAERSGVFFGEMMEMPYPWEPAIRSAFVEALALRGETELARREFEQLAKRDFRELPRDEHWISTMGSLAGAAAAVGDERRSALLYRLLEPYAELFMVHDILVTLGGSVAMMLGSLATLLGRYREGAAHFERAIEKESAAGAPLAVAHSKASYARLLLLRGEPGDRERARELIDEAKAGWEALRVRARRRLAKAFEPLGVDLDSPEPLPKV